MERCTLCQTAAPEVGRLGGRRFHLCPVCDLVFVPTHQHVGAEAARARYLKHRNSPDDVGYTDRFSRLIELLRGQAPGARRVLDYGCGPTPVFVEMLRAAGYDASGYDPLFCPDSSLHEPFDVVASVETFEHFTRPGDELARIVARIRPGGMLAVMTLFHHGAESLGNWWYLRDPTHVAFYSQATFDFIAPRFGLTIVHRDERDTIILRRNA